MKTNTERRLKLTKLPNAAAKLGNVKLDKKAIMREIQDNFFILIGLSLYAFGWVGFFLPARMATGGVTAIGALLSYANDMHHFLPQGIDLVSLTYFSINAVLLVISIRVFGFKFSLKTICCVFVMTFLLALLRTIITAPLVNSDALLTCILGGVLCGAGIGVVINYKGSTGGTDIIALIINKYKHISIGKSMLFCDVVIISSSYLIFHSVDKIVYGLVAMAVSSYAVDMVINGARQSEQFMIFSEKYDRIATEINKLHRGCTVLDGIGWYTKKSVKVIVVVVKKREALTIMRIVNDIDPSAFISQSMTRGVYGEGFGEITV
ncbi:membrane protein [Bacteroidia bacterium]|nr:membrane protein [Bacteroidia bacterium]